MNFLDPRVTPARPDLAAAHLQGKVDARRFVEGEPRVVVEPVTALRPAPAADAPLDTQALFGERVTVYETTDEGWAWGQLVADGYVGWLPAAALGSPSAAVTHRVRALGTFVFPGPSIKLPPLASLPFGARVAVAREAPPFAVTDRNGHIPLVHLEPVGARDADFVSVAERFVGTPYLWGGKTSRGIDCSGLVQVALTACGVACPRDSDMQQEELGAPIADAGAISAKLARGAAALRRGDLVFWRGHVGIVRAPDTLLHANAFHMAVASESLAEALARIRAAGEEPIAFRRL